MTETDIIEKLLEGDEEFKRIYFEHRELDDVVRSLESKGSLTLDDEMEVRKLKKVKLSLKDRMEAKIAEWKHK
ncbi:MAG TPA: DUF465 domain-containing protein [Thermodesulfobacteriota bacterium]|jgi:uncharacterized protein YdcH (DUF465 family)|nr:MAG: DUF465 domain-containing protein [Candidatus Dadabacteria bacterium]HKQ31594.1 DUF465 domain-containing protein [Thermodesulfobacteriota bacterium]